MTRSLVLLSAVGLALYGVAAAADVFVVEDWAKQTVGAKGIPAGWRGQNWGEPVYDMTVVEDGGRRALHLKSKDAGSTVVRDVKGKVNLDETPILEWTWKVAVLPKGGDSRKSETDDQAAQIYVGWPRTPEPVRSRIIGYVWDTTAPVGTIVKSKKTRTITYVVVRSGAADLNRWVTERRNVAEDFKMIYGETAENPGGISVAIDSNDTHSTAESLVGAITFKAR